MSTGPNPLPLATLSEGPLAKGSPGGQFVGPGPVHLPVVGGGGFGPVHPVAVYLARLSEGSRKSTRLGLRVIARLLAGARATEATVPWWALTYAETSAVRALVADHYAPATANKLLAYLRAILRECWKLELGARDALERAADLATVRGRRLPPGRALGVAELRLVLAAADPRDRTLLLVLAGCGLRAVEAARLRWADWERGDRVLRVLGKGCAYRLAHTPEAVHEALAAWHRPDDWRSKSIFRLGVRGIGQVCTRLAARVDGADHFTPHDLRRTFITGLLAADVDVLTVQGMAGHADPRTTARYDRRGEDAKRAAAGKVAL